MNQRGFTIVEIIITITIMAILLTLGVVALNSTQTQARDSERAADVEAVQAYLESYYNTGVSDNATIPTITNLIDNPSIETNTTSVSSSGVTTARVSTWSSNGTYSLQLTPGSASDTDSFAWIGGCNAGTGTLCLGMQAGKTYTLTARQRIPVSLTGTLFPVRAATISLWQLSGGVYSSSISSSDTTAGVRTLSVTLTLASNATEAFIRLYHGGLIGSGTVFYDSIILTEGPSRYNYADGNTNGWTWNGTLNNSTSSGPAVYSFGPGTYPSTSIASSGQIDIFLRDADLKSFSAPGISDPYITFLPATNNTQTTAGVRPIPTKDNYVYQPIDTAGNLCDGTDCRRYNIYYVKESDGSINMVTSKNQ